MQKMSSYFVTFKKIDKKVNPRVILNLKYMLMYLSTSVTSVSDKATKPKLG